MCSFRRSPRPRSALCWARMARRALRTSIVFAGAAGLVGFFAPAACSTKGPDPTPPPTLLTKEQLMDPSQCGSCHLDHYKQWVGSMHAYAADDPLFLAMNARGQRETGGKLGTFCVQCHAPLAVRAGLTDGKSPEKLPAAYKGVTCFFCHSIASVEGAHNDPLKLGDDGVMRAGISDPKVELAPHKAAYSKLHDHDQLDSASACGSCHDIENANGVALGRTYAEWKGSLFAHDVTGVRLTCAGCHMTGKDGFAASVAGAPPRRVHDHTMAAVDVALTDFPQKAAQLAEVQKNLDPSLVTRLCVTGSRIEVWLDDAFAGHDFPSGASYHRRAWVEMTASKSGAVVWTLGKVPDDKAVATVTDPDFWRLGDQMLDAAGKPTEMLWTTASEKLAQLPPAVTNVKSDPAFYHAVIKDFRIPVDFDALTLQVHIRPVDFDFVDDLIATSDLDPSFRGKLATFTLAGATKTWTSDMGSTCIPAL